jgi:hypothetical protein
MDEKHETKDNDLHKTNRRTQCNDNPNQINNRKNIK